MKSCLRFFTLRAGNKRNLNGESNRSFQHLQKRTIGFFQQYVYSRVGIVLEDDKHYLFESRLAPIVKELGLASINDLCVFLHKERDAKVAQQS